MTIHPSPDKAALAVAVESLIKTGKRRSTTSSPSVKASKKQKSNIVTPQEEISVAGRDDTPDLTNVFATHAREKEAIECRLTAERDAALGQIAVLRSKVANSQALLENTGKKLKSMSEKVEEERGAATVKIEGLQRELEELKSKQKLVDLDKQKAVVEQDLANKRAHRAQAASANTESRMASLRTEMTNMESVRESESKFADMESRQLRYLILDGVEEHLKNMDDSNTPHMSNANAKTGRQDLNTIPTAAELEELRADHIVDPRSIVSVDIVILRRSRAIKENPLILLRPQFPIGRSADGLYVDVPLRGRYQHGQTSDQVWAKLDLLFELSADDDYRFGGRLYRGEWNSSLDRVAAFSWCFNMLYELSINPKEEDQDALKWLEGMYESHVDLMVEDPMLVDYKLSCEE